jgi:hypothetical protein
MTAQDIKACHGIKARRRSKIRVLPQSNNSELHEIVELLNLKGFSRSKKENEGSELDINKEKRVHIHHPEVQAEFQSEQVVSLLKLREKKKKMNDPKTNKNLSTYQQNK